MPDKREPVSRGKLSTCCYSSLCAAFVFSTIALFPTSPFNTKISKTLPSTKSEEQDHAINDRDCDLFKGHWVRDSGGPLYTNTSCPTIPSWHNCFMQGRPDRDFLNWRWKPDKCELQRFDSNKFLGMVRGKRMTFFGDSVARNHMESLLCVLSQVEAPQNLYKDSEDRDRIWFFPDHNFTLSTKWARFLVADSERKDVNNISTGIFDLNLDQLGPPWERDLPETDIAVVSAGHWFFRPIVFHRSGDTIGSISCNLTNVTQLEHISAFSLVYASVLDHISNCQNCKQDLITIVRTFSPAHFENGAWNTGGSCPRTGPVGEDEIDLQKYDMIIGRTQAEEFKRWLKNKDKKKVGIMDVTRAMMMRPDGHPNEYYGNRWTKGFNDCLHWCVPGPVDTWNEFLMALLINLM